MKIFAALLAGGTGSRLGSEFPKQFINLGNKPVIIHSAAVFDCHTRINGLICVSNTNFINETEKIFFQYNIKKTAGIICGGNTRQESSAAAVNFPLLNDDDIILIHDAARPFITADLIDNLINSAEKYGCAGTYVKSVDTAAIIKDDFVIEVPSRENIYMTQTPQAFRVGIIRKCHHKAESENFPVTDDAGLAVNYGYKVKSVEGNINNFKITNRGDIEKAELILKGLR